MPEKVMNFELGMASKLNKILVMKNSHWQVLSTVLH